MIDLSRLLTRVPHDSVEAVVGMARLNSTVLNAHLREQLGKPAHGAGGILTAPFLEGAFPWQLSDGWEGEAKALLHPRTLEVLRQVSRPPYSHQVEAWSHLCGEDPASVIVTSGTGSGKTECFMTPILDRLVKLSNGGSTPLEGVRALMLYPLNALINSQEERLERWFEPFAGRFRYALYNGEMPERAPASGRLDRPWRVDNRKDLRGSPPPVVVTNVTMLEYMLIRQKDAAILRRSQGTLDYIVLDEAHSYVGAQAAEIALLLRRVALAFGRRPEDLRYVATSATIGDGSEEPLRQFLRDLSGAPDDQVHVVTGRRAALPGVSGPSRSCDPKDLATLGADQVSEALAGSGPLRDVRETLRSGQTISWPGWRASADRIAGRSLDDRDAVQLLVQAASAHDPAASPALVAAGGDAVLPVRAHLFHGTLAGLWTCISPSCPGKPALEGKDDWPFGSVYLERRDRCRHCRQLILEWAFCGRCGDGALKAEEFDGGTRIGQWSDTHAEDEFALNLSPDETFGHEAEDEETAEAARPSIRRRYLCEAPRPGLTRLTIDPETGAHFDSDASGGVSYWASADLQRCPCCEASPPRVDPDRGVLRPLSAGAPFLMAQIAPGLLGALSPRPDAVAAPFDGRQLISFTDARQGTARHAANIQIGSERGFIRAFLYHSVQSLPRPVSGMDDAAFEALRVAAATSPALAPVLSRAESERANAQAGLRSKAWPDLVRDLANDPTLRDHLRSVWEPRDEKFADPSTLAEFLLYREIMRRPLASTNAETLGLVRFVIPGIDDGVVPLPQAASVLGLDQKDWSDVLRLLLTHFVRTNVALDFDHDWMPWIDRRQRPIEIALRSPTSTSQRYVRFWPYAAAVRPNRVVRLLSQALALPLSDRTNRDRIDELLAEAWRVLKPHASASTNGYRFKLDRFRLAPVERALFCPITRRLVDTGFRGLSPYDRGGPHPLVGAVDLPILRFPWLRDEDDRSVTREAVEAWLAEDQTVRSLRERGVWGDQQDRAALFMPWIRAAEHSAQMDGPSLRNYEASFKAGQVNVLSCSTTMEMGVDIGSIEAVLNTNTPPAIANYRQRVGRAGRQRQPISVGLTLCKDRPLDRAAFADPAAFLNQTVRPPRVSLDSPVIARRQASAFLLARFLNGEGSELHKLTVGGFFGLGSATTTPGPTGVDRFLGWLDLAAADPEIHKDLEKLLRGTPLYSDVAAGPRAELWSELRDRMETVAAEIEAEWESLAADGADVDALENRPRNLQRERLAKAYLLSELAGRGFLPSHGFPTDVVPFAMDTAGDRRRALVLDQDNRSQSRGYPSRSRDVAVFEYAPGRGIVVDGIVRESGGVTLNWKRPVHEVDVREVQSLRTVSACGGCGTLWSAPSAADRRECPECGWNEPQTIEYLAPAGFAVASDYQPHDDASDLGHLPPVDPRVSARNGVWRALPDPGVGRFRTSASGLVFWFNPGPHGFGYAVCLHCGRSEAETTDRGGVALEDHRPLRGGPRVGAAGFCSGAPSVNGFAVKRRLKFGHEIRTDVCELQLYDCASREAALAIALAVREAIARRLGVDPDEMGFAAPPSRIGNGGGRTWSAVVFDRASGGAGFSATFGDAPEEILREARNLLDCSAAGRCGDDKAVNVCPLCVLAADSQHSAEDTDRAAAFRILSDVARRLALPDTHRLFGAASRYENSPLKDAIARELQKRPTGMAIVPLRGDPVTWDLDNWPAAGMLSLWSGRERRVVLVCDGADLAAADILTRREVVLWAQRMNADLATSEALDTRYLAIVQDDSGAVAWGLIEAGADKVDGGWGATSNAPVVLGDCPPVADLKQLDLSALLSQGARETIVEIGSDLDGPAEGFGGRLRALLRSTSPEVDRALSAPCVRLIYSDRYLFTPSGARLASELVAAFAGPDAEIEVVALAQPRHPRSRSSRMRQDWPSMSLRKLVFDTMLARVSSKARFEPDPDVPHRRTLRFEGPSGSGIIYFDQGLGAWEIDAPFDFSAPVEEQVAALAGILPVSANEGGTYLAVKLTDWDACG